MAWLRSRNDTLRFGEDGGSVENVHLVVSPRLNSSLVRQDRQRESDPVVPQPPSVNGGRNELVAQRVHLVQRYLTGGVTVIIHVLAFCYRWTSRCFGSDELDVFRCLLRYFVVVEGPEEPRETASPADAADELVRILTHLLKLPHRLQTHDGLMQKHVVQNTSDTVLCSLMRYGVLHGLAYGDA